MLESKVVLDEGNDIQGQRLALLEQSTVNIDCFSDAGRWDQNNMDEVLPFIKKWQITQLYSLGNPKSFLLNSISQIRFSKLKLLLLEDIGLQTIQHINRLYAPELQEFCISRNHFCTIKSLRKVYWKKMQSIELFASKTTDYENLNIIDMSLQRLFMDYNETEDFRKKKNRNLAWIVKLNKKPSQLSLNRKQRPQSAKIIGIMKNQYNVNFGLYEH